MMVRAKIEEYRVTKNAAVLEDIKAAAKSDKIAVAFLFTIDPENYKDALFEANQEIMALCRDENGLFVSAKKNQEDLLSEVMPVYTLFETKCNKKENYADIVKQCQAAVKKYPGSNKIFAMLSEVLEYFSEEIYEHYKTVQRLLWEQYVAVSAHMDGTVAYALAKACFYKAFLLEKYEDDLAAYANESYPAAFYSIKRLEQRFEYK